MIEIHAMASEPDIDSDHRKRPRRRGQVLNAAILQATLDELDEGGYATLTMERIAERAGASKASVYRRWPTRIELVMDAVYYARPDPTSTPDTGSLRGDLLAALRQAAGLLTGPSGEALRGLLSDVLRDSARTAQVRRNSRRAGRRTMQEIARRAIERGEINASAVTPQRLEVGQALLRDYFLFGSDPIPDEIIVDIVDDVILPLFSLGRRSTTRT
jgi:AcrR family transcriptional regulator